MFMFLQLGLSLEILWSMILTTRMMTGFMSLIRITRSSHLKCKLTHLTIVFCSVYSCHLRWITWLYILKSDCIMFTGLRALFLSQRCWITKRGKELVLSHLPLALRFMCVCSLMLLLRYIPLLLFCFIVLSYLLFLEPTFIQKRCFLLITGPAITVN